MAAPPGLVLLTGATGFVGRQVLRALGERGCRVRPVVREGKQERLPSDAAIETIVASPDIFAESTAWWARTCSGIDTVIHVSDSFNDGCDRAHTTNNKGRPVAATTAWTR